MSNSLTAASPIVLTLSTTIEQDQIARLSKSLAKAFATDPFCCHIAPNAATREADHAWWFSVLLKYTYQRGEVHVADSSFTSCAMWIGPDSPVISTPGMIAAGLYKVPFILGLKSLFRVLDISGQLEKLHKQELKRHYYLMILGVDPVLQGKGTGTALLAPGLKRADAEGLPCYLETATERNIGYYQKLDFRVIKQVLIKAPQGDWTYWTMRRDPVTR